PPSLPYSLTRFHGLAFDIVILRFAKTFTEKSGLRKKPHVLDTLSNGLERQSANFLIKMRSKAALIVQGLLEGDSCFLFGTFRDIPRCDFFSSPVSLWFS